jgi:imidazolonepropionase-like amidohydrolase
MGSKHFLLTGATIIKGTDEPPIPEATVEIKNGRIINIAEEKIFRNKKIRVIDVSGMTVLPGLIDMHAHHVARFDAMRKLLLSHGVTTVRDSEVSPKRARLFNIQKKLRVGNKASPRIFLTSPFFDSSPKKGDLALSSKRFLTKPIAINDPKSSRSQVKKARKWGFQVLEVNYNIEEEILKTIADSAKDLDLPLLGDFMFSRRVFASQAVKAGVKALDHASGIAQQFCDNLDEVGFFEEWNNVNEKEVLAFAPALAKTGVFLIPTLVWFETQSKLSEQSVDCFKLFEKLPEGVRRGWMRPNPLFGLETWEKGARASFQKLKEFLGVFVGYGGKVVTGTDSPVYFVFPGLSIHREMELLVASNLTPIQAIQAATRNSAELLGEPNIGTIEKGKLADLLVIEGNPLDDIKSTRNVKIVIKDGETYYPKRLLDSI